MQLARQLGQVCFSYSTDNTANGNAYPSGLSATAIANQLISSSYISDPSIFCVSGAAGGQKVYSGPLPVVLTSTNITWNFTVATLTTTGGVTSNTGDLIPLVYFTGQSASYPATTQVESRTATHSALWHGWHCGLLQRQ